jgi:hypothetical protein
MNDFIFYWNEEKLISKISVKMFKNKWNLYIGVFVVHEKNRDITHVRRLRGEM